MTGRTVSHYRILEKVGQGGMGEVFLAEDTRLGRQVALKFLPPELSRDPDAKARFVHEAKAASALDHANVCTVHDIGEDADGRMFMVMPYYEGCTLKEILARGGITEAIPAAGESAGARPHAGTGHAVPLPVDDVIAIASQAARGLAAAHAKGIVHRDVKPANLFVTADGTVKVLDFGIAKLAGSQTKLTKTGSTVGTVAYMSPEQAMGKEVDARTDIWSLGVILYEMLAGDVPFKGDYPQAVIYTVINEEPKPLAKARADIPAGMERIVLQALAKNPRDRYQNMNDLAPNLKAAGEGTQRIRTRVWGLRTNKFVKKTFYLSATAATLAVLLALNVGGVRKFLFGPGTTSSQTVRLAVLPFANLSNDPEQEYFSDGLTQEMISQLGRLHPQSLNVIARTSVMRYKKTDTPIDQIGKELGVDYVMEGSVRREAGRVRVTANLVRVKGQAQLWADSFEREMTGILALQSDVAGKVAGALALKLLSSEQTRLAGAPSVNAEAYDAVLKGQYHWRKLKAQEFDTAQRYFELALAKDPSYAPAYAGLAVVWSGRRQMGIMAAGDVAAQWKAATLRAVALDEDSITAHDALSSYLTWYEWDWAGAEPHWRKTIELDPNDATNQASYSHFLAVTGRLDEAVIHIEVAVKLDPFNELILGFYAAVLNFVSRYEEAAAAARKALSLQPDSPIAISQLDIALFMLGRHDEILALRRKNYAADPERLAALERGYTEAGFKGAMRRVADLLAARYEKSRSRTGTVGLAMTYLKAGDKDKAMDWLEKAFEDRDGNLPYIGRPIWDPLRDDPRFQKLLRKMHLPGGDRK